MLILISPAKTLRDYPYSSLPLTEPLYLKEAEQIAFEMSGMSPADLATHLKTTPLIASKVYKMYSAFMSPETMASPAVFAYNGAVYRNLSPETLRGSAQAAMIKQLRMTSFLYGLLRPTDAVKPYRLEGDVSLAVTGGKSLFSFWRSRLTAQLIQESKEQGGSLLFLASEEMKRLFDWKAVCREVKVIQPLFKVRNGDKVRQIVMYTKMMRGQMCRHALTNGLKGTIKEVHDFAALVDAQEVINEPDGMTVTLVF